LGSEIKPLVTRICIEGLDQRIESAIQYLLSPFEVQYVRTADTADLVIRRSAGVLSPVAGPDARFSNNKNSSTSSLKDHEIQSIELPSNLLESWTQKIEQIF